MCRKDWKPNIAAAMEGPARRALGAASYLLALSIRHQAAGSVCGRPSARLCPLSGNATGPAQQALYECGPRELRRSNPILKAEFIPGSRHFFWCLLKQQDCGRNRRMLSRSLFVFGLLLRFWIPAHATAAVAVMDPTGCPATHLPVVTMFHFPVAPPTPGSDISSQCFVTTTTAFETLDFFFPAPPTASDISSCTSTFFAICNITESGGITDVHFALGTDSGIPTDTDFEVALQGFTTGQQIDALANIPEPVPALTVGLSLIAAAAVRVWRRAPLRLMRGRKE